MVGKVLALKRVGCSLESSWDVAPCSHVEVDRRFRGVYASIIRTINFNVTTRRYIPEDSKLHTRRRENLKSMWGEVCL
jgi:hypothetical protein